MAYRFVLIPLRSPAVVEEELNKFLQSYRVFSVDRRWVDQGLESFWSVCVDYLESGQDGTALNRASGERGKVVESGFPSASRPTALSCCPKMRLISLNIVCLVSDSSARPT